MSVTLICLSIWSGNSYMFKLIPQASPTNFEVLAPNFILRALRGDRSACDDFVPPEAREKLWLSI